MKNKIKISHILLCFLLLSFAVIVLPFSKSFQKNIGITSQFLFIGIISIIEIIKDNYKRNFSLNLIHWFFIYTFMFCAGIIQFANDEFRWDFIPNTIDIVVANFVVIIWCILYLFIYYVIRIKSNKNISNNENICLFSTNNFGFVTLLIFLLIISVISIFLVDFKAFFIRSLYEKSAFNRLFSQSSVSMIVLSLIRGISLWLTMIAFLRYKENKNIINLIFLFLVLFNDFILVPPLGVARYVFACFYGGTALFYIKIFKTKNIFFFVLFIGLLIIFPMLNAFRGLYTNNVSLDFIRESIGNIKLNFASSDYDSYTMLVYVIHYCEKMGITWGKQLLGTLLFFIPRVIWPSKPTGSGALIINTLATTSVNSNVSCPLIGEGYINYGIIGVIIFCIIFVVLIKKIDELFWSKNNSITIYGKMLYSFAILFLVYMLRGDLISTFSTFCGYYFSLLFVKKIIKVT